MTATDHAGAGAERPAGTAARTVATLHAERDFLLRSIADLESEHATGELSDARYEALLDGYTVQAATAMRAIERLGGAGELVEAGGRRRGRRTPAIVASVLVLFVIGGGLLVRSLGDRQPGQTITGNAQSVGPDLDAVARAARDQPDDAGTQLDYAQALLQAGQALDALKAFDAAARLDPRNPEPQAYAGWIVFLAGLTDDALPRLDAAVAVDPAYPDARFLRGMVLLRGRGDAAGALVELREFVRLATPGPERDQVQALINELEGETPTSTTEAAP